MTSKAQDICIHYGDCDKNASCFCEVDDPHFKCPHRKYLGCFKAKSDAIKARKDAENKYLGDFKPNEVKHG